MREHDILGREAPGTNLTIIEAGAVTYGPATGGFDRDPMGAYIATVMR